MIFQRLRDLLQCASERGLLVTGQIFLSSLHDRFDTEFAIETENGQTTPENSLYLPSRSEPFRHMLRHFRPHRDATFVDYGAGKGRVLILAAEYGFTRVKGIEYSDALCRQAEANWHHVRSRFPHSQCRLLCTRAEDYSVQSEDDFFYFYDPFPAAVVEACVRNICRSFAQNPRHITIIYHNNLRTLSEIFGKFADLQSGQEFTHSGNRFFSYKLSPK